MNICEGGAALCSDATPLILDPAFLPTPDGPPRGDEIRENLEREKNSTCDVLPHWDQADTLPEVPRQPDRGDDGAEGQDESAQQRFVRGVHKEKVKGGRLSTSGRRAHHHRGPAPVDSRPRLPPLPPGRAIRWELIEQSYDQMVMFAAAIWGPRLTSRTSVLNTSAFSRSVAPKLGCW
jgi:hypothetical protein